MHCMLKKREVKMFNLKESRDKTFDICLEDGTTLNIDSLNYELYVEIYKMGNFMTRKNKETQTVRYIYKFTTKLFNNNLNGIKFKQREIEKMLNIDVAMHLIKAYQDYANETLLLMHGEQQII